MEITPFAQYVADQADNRKVQKCVNRAIKRYRHACCDLAHADADLLHAKGDCENALKTLDETLARYKTHFDTWLLEDEEGIQIIDESSDSAAEEAEDDHADQGHDDHIGEDALAEAMSKLEHAARDFKHAIKDARHAAADLDEVEYLLLEVMDFAEDDGVSLNLVEAKAYVAAQAVIEENKPTPPAE